MSCEENELHVGAVAAPIMVRQPDGQPQCVGVVSVAAPTWRVDRDGLMALAPALLRGVAKLSDMWPIGGALRRTRSII